MSSHHRPPPISGGHVHKIEKKGWTPLWMPLEADDVKRRLRVRGSHAGSHCFKKMSAMFVWEMYFATHNLILGKDILIGT